MKYVLVLKNGHNVESDLKELTAELVNPTVLDVLKAIEYRRYVPVNEKTVYFSDSILGVSEKPVKQTDKCLEDYCVYGTD